MDGWEANCRHGLILLFAARPAVPVAGPERNGKSPFARRSVHRRSAVIRISKILYPTDFSSHSNQAYFHAVALAEKHNAGLSIAFVYSPEQGSKEKGEATRDQDYW